MKILEHDLHITKKIGKPYFERGVWNQVVEVIVNYKQETHVITHPDYEMIVALKVDRLSIQQPNHTPNILYL